MVVPLKENAKKVVYKIDRQLRVLFDNSNELKICMLDNTGRIVGWNISAERLTGYLAKEVMGKNYSMFISKAERNRKVFKKTLAIAENKGQFSAEGIRVRKDGSHFWARSCITPMKEKDGSVKFFVMITQDISQDRAAEQKKDEFMGIASHELKTPITTLSLYSELLAKRLELDRDTKNLRMLRDIQGQAARLVTLVDDLLVVGKIEQGALELHKEVFNPNRLIEGIVRDIQNGTASHKIISTGTVARQVRADKNRVAQVFTNLLLNAIKYSPQANKTIVRTVSRKNKCIISIQDFGPGIAKKDQRDIFTRFFRTDNTGAVNVSGSGLGLYISRGIIKKHRERIWVKSIEGKGATFFFTLSFA